jgi:hypothetical protein
MDTHAISQALITLLKEGWLSEEQYQGLMSRTPPEVRGVTLRIVYPKDTQG